MHTFNNESGLSCIQRRSLPQPVLAALQTLEEGSLLGSKCGELRASPYCFPGEDL
jgi:hypothetical protein